MIRTPGLQSNSSVFFWARDFLLNLVQAVARPLCIDLLLYTFAAAVSATATATAAAAATVVADVALQLLSNGGAPQSYRLFKRL